MEDLERTLQRLALMERRVARLEAIIREKVADPTEPEAPAANGASKQRLLDPAPNSSLQFPEIRLQLVDPPAKPQEAECKTVAVRAAVEQYDHLLGPLSTLWGHPEFDRYINRLIVDDRGSRRGFGPTVMEELLFLAQLNHFICPNWHPCDPWEDSQFINDRI